MAQTNIPAPHDPDQFLRLLQARLKLAKGSWQADKTSVSHLTVDQQNNLLGCNEGKGEPTFGEARRISQENYRHFRALTRSRWDSLDAAEAAPDYPPAFDWRNVNGRNFITPVRNQNPCGSCVAFGTCATLEGAAHVLTDIAVSDPGGGAMEELSEAAIYYCNGCNCSPGGWYLSAAMEAAQSQGVPPESCMPYKGKQQSCEERCADWESKITQVNQYHYITNTSDMKVWLSSKGPLLTRFDVYRDFFDYKSGVYRHTTGGYAGGHAVCCVGYSDTLQAWLCRNSWGANWGEDGFFWIGYGQCGIDAGMYAVDSLSKIYPLYNDIYMRDNLSDIGQIPGMGGASASPDIIPWGPIPAPNFQTLFKKNWGQDLGKNLSANQINYVYVRGKNLAFGATTGQIYLYWSKASLLLWPSKWRQNQLSTSTQASSATVSAARQGDVVVGSTPFLWKPDPITADHYCLISQVVTQQHPNPIPPDGSITDFAIWVLNNPNIAWRNVSVVDTGNTPSFQAPVNLNVTDAVTLYVGLRTNGIPQGCQVALSCGTAGPNPGLNLAQVTVPGDPNYMVGVRSQIPANFSSDVIVSFWKNGRTLAPNAELVLECFYFPSANTPSEAALLPYAVDGALLAEALQAAGQQGDAAAVTPTRAVLLGSYRFQLI